MFSMYSQFGICSNYFFFIFLFFLFGLSHIQYISTENLYILMNKHVKYEENLIITHNFAD